MKNVTLVLLLIAPSIPLGGISNYFKPSKRKEYCQKKARVFNDNFENHWLHELNKCMEEGTTCEKVRNDILKAFGSASKKHENPNKFGSFFNPLVGFFHPEIERLRKNEKSFVLWQSFFQGEEIKAEIRKQNKFEGRLAVMFLGSVATSVSGLCFWIASNWNQK